MCRGIKKLGYAQTEVGKPESTPDLMTLCFVQNMVGSSPIGALIYYGWSIYWSIWGDGSKPMNIEIGSYEAKTKLPELLRSIKSGNRYTITLRGKAVADLVPAQGNRHSEAVAAVDDMLSYMQAHKSGAGFDLKAMINEGRA